MPWGVHTKSGRPLAEDVSSVIASGLVAKGIKVTVVTVPPKDSREQAIKALTNTGKPRALLVSIDEWQTDMGPNTPGKTESTVGMAMAFAVRADVFDEKGDVLAALEKLLNDRKIVEALR